MGKYYVWVSYDESVGGPAFGGETFDLDPDRVWRAIAIADDELTASRLCDVLMQPEHGDFEFHYNAASEFTDKQQLNIEKQIAECLDNTDPRISRFLEKTPEWPPYDLTRSAALMLAAIRRDLQTSEPTAQRDANEQLDELVTLNQVSGLVPQGKRQLERYVAAGKIPPADFPGGEGKAHRWRWSAIRPALIEHCRADLPERFPGSRLI